MMRPLHDSPPVDEDARTDVARVVEDDKLTKAIRQIARAAKAAAAAGVDLDDYMTAAWDAYLMARPGLQEELEHNQLVAQIEELRAAGKLGSA